MEGLYFNDEIIKLLCERKKNSRINFTVYSDELISYYAGLEVFWESVKRWTGISIFLWIINLLLSGLYIIVMVDNSIFNW